MRDEVGGSETKGPEPDANGGAGAEQGSATGERTGAPSHDHHKHRWRRWVLWIVLLIIIALIAIWGIRKWLYSRDHESTDDAQIAGHLVPVLNRVSAYVTGVFVHNGDHVTTGQLLVRLEETDLRPALAEAEAAVAEAEAAAAGGTGRAAGGPPGQASAQILQARQQAAAAAAQVDAARAQATRAERDLSRAEELAPQGIISRQALDAAREAAATAEANLRAAEEQRAAAAAAVTSAEAGARGAAARLEAARAAVEQARLQLSYTRITAPVPGIVANRNVDPGQLLEPGQPLMVVVADSGVHVTANFKETQVANLRPGQPVEIDIDAYGDCDARGVVESIGGATGSEFALLPPNNATGNFVKVVQRIPVRIVVTRDCGPARRLRPGMSVTVHVRTGDRK